MRGTERYFGEGLEHWAPAVVSGSITQAGELRNTTDAPPVV
jgi:hypothetical protein